MGAGKPSAAGAGGAGESEAVAAAGELEAAGGE